jgi:hypothetical protein
MGLFRLAVLVIAPLALAGCTPAEASPTASSTVTSQQATPTAQADLTLAGKLYDGICTGFGDITAQSHINLGDQVVVRDGSNNILGVGRLEKGLAADNPIGCNYRFEITDLPQVSVYSVTVGSYPPLVFSLTELQAMDWATLLILDVPGDLSAGTPE